MTVSASTPSQLPRLKWPEKKWPEGVWIAGMSAALLSGVSLLWTGLAQADWGVRLGSVLISIVLPIAVWQLWPRVTVLVARIGQYDKLHDSLEQAYRDLAESRSARKVADDQMKELSESLEETKRRLHEQEDVLQSLLYVLQETEHRTFKVLDVTWKRSQAWLVIGDTDPPQLRPGRKLLVAHSRDFRLLGHYEVKENGRQGWLATYIGKLDPVWWGFLTEQAKQGQHPTIDLTAYLLFEGERFKCLKIDPWSRA